MLKLIVQGNEFYDEETSSFITTEGFEVELEHSLLSLSKWESKHQVPFLGQAKLTTDQIVDYILCMNNTPNVTTEMISSAGSQVFDAVNEYINSPQSATTFGEMPKPRGRGEVITSELIYYWMVAFNIPFTCEAWHLNRLFSLIKIANIKNSKGKRLSRSEVVQRNRELNAKRKAELGTTG